MWSREALTQCCGDHWQVLTRELGLWTTAITSQLMEKVAPLGMCAPRASVHLRTIDRGSAIVLVTVQDVPVCKLLTADLKEMDYLATGQSPSAKPIGLPFKRGK